MRLGTSVATRYSGLSYAGYLSCVLIKSGYIPSLSALSGPSQGPCKDVFGEKLERGSALVEFGLIAIVLFTLIFGIVDFGRALFAYHYVANTAREATRMASVRGNDCQLPPDYSENGIDMGCEMPISKPRPPALESIRTNSPS